MVYIDMNMGLPQLMRECFFSEFRHNSFQTCTDFKRPLTSKAITLGPVYLLRFLYAKGIVLGSPSFFLPVIATK